MSADARDYQSLNVVGHNRRMAGRRKSKIGKWLVTGALVAALGGGTWWWVAASNRPTPPRGNQPSIVSPVVNPKKPPAHVQEKRRATSPARPVAPAAMPVDRVRKTAVPRPALPIGG